MILLLLLPSLLSGFGSVITGLLSGLVGILTQIVVGIAGTIRDIFITIIFLPMEIVVNGLISVVNTLPISIDFYDLNASGACDGAAGSPSAPSGGRCTP